MSYGQVYRLLVGMLMVFVLSCVAEGIFRDDQKRHLLMVISVLVPRRIVGFVDFGVGMEGKVY